MTRWVGFSMRTVSGEARTEASSRFSYVIKCTDVPMGCIRMCCGQENPLIPNPLADGNDQMIGANGNWTLQPVRVGTSGLDLIR
jgi:hypothetical protein